VGERVVVQVGPLSGCEGTFLGYRRKVPEEAEVRLAFAHRSTYLQLPWPHLGWAVLPETEIGDALHVQLVPLENDLVRRLARDPSLLQQLSPHGFEVLVAELLRDMGYDVFVTPATRDGGRDVLAVFQLPAGPHLTIVDCKRYSPDRHIGPDIVQRLLWVSDRHDRASHAIIATTSSFTSGARALESEYRWRLSLHDHPDLCSWLGKYGTWSEQRPGGIWLPRNPVLTPSSEA
jgi:hypothetical protein